ncbi:hypothetical protein ACCT17_34190 [Rhizobium ruizarguesonis]
MKKTDIDAWYEQIAKKAKRDREIVESVLTQNSIRSIIKPAVPQRLRIVSLSFTGKKSGVATGPISFEWPDLKPGLHAIVSSHNFRGKTTILQMLKFGLVGSSGPQDDIDAWFQTLTLRFMIDDDVFETRLEDFASRTGSLVQFKNGNERSLYSFDGAEAFKATMEGFFLDKLGLRATRIVIDKGGKEVTQEHGWPWLSSIMTIDPAPEDVFGGVPGLKGGMPSYLTRMFFGLPWVETFTDIKAAAKKLKLDDAQMDQATSRNRSAAQDRLAELEREREDLAKKLSGPSDFDALVASERAEMVRLALLAPEIGALTKKVSELKENVAQSGDALTEARRNRHAFDEAEQAGTIFRLLQPEYCPSCDEVFTDEYRQEKQNDHDCVVCGRHEKGQEDLTGVREQLLEREQEAKDQVKKLSAALTRITNSVAEKSQERTAVEAELLRLHNEMRGAQSTASSWRDAIKIDAQIDEVRRLVAVPPGKDEETAAILKAAEKVTNDLFSSEQEELLAEVAELTVKFARSFGMNTLERVEFVGVQMRVHKSGSVVAFGASTPGERTRLKIAANLAMIQVTETRGVGRHPGLLFIDSPGANEAKDENVAQIIEGLADLPNVLPGVQVFFTAIESERILAHVPCDNVIKSRADGYLW